MKHRRKRYRRAVFRLTLIGAIAGLLLTYVLTFGWPWPQWRPVEKAPQRVSQLLALQRDSLWVQGMSGEIFFIEEASRCKHDCWQEVSEVVEKRIVDDDYLEVSDRACEPLPPLRDISAVISECRRGPFTGESYAFALKENGNIYFHEDTVYYESLIVSFAYGGLTGAIIFFVVGMLLVFVQGIIDKVK